MKLFAIGDLHLSHASDKLARSKRVQAANTAAKLLGAPPAAIPYSSETGEGRDAMLMRIGQVVEDVKMLKGSIDIEQSDTHNS